DGERQWRRQPMKPTDCIKLSLSIVRMSILTSNGQEIRFPSIRTCFAALSVFLVLTTLTLYSSSTAFAIGRPLRGSPPSPRSATSPSSSKPHAAGMRSSARASAGRVQASDEPIIGVAELNVERRGHTATQLADGKILIIGGENQNGLVKESEIFNPRTRKSSVAARTIVARTDHTATPLADGRVLVVGGRNHKGPLNSTEIFDPKTKSFLKGALLNHARAGHTATVLADGRILIVGGDVEGSAEIYDPTLQSFILVKASLSAPRAFHSAVLLQNGKVLIAGGLGSDGNAVKTAEIFDAAKMSFSAPRNTMRGARSRPM